MNGKEWTASEIEQLLRMYPEQASCDVAAALNRSLTSVYAAARVRGLKKSAAYIASHCRLRRGVRVSKATEFKPGQVPANKGLRRPGYAPGRMRETQFKKGNQSANYLPIGSERVDSDGYLRVKIADGLGGFGNSKVWAFVHRMVWEAAHGPIPKGYRIWWKDGDRMNCALDNLELLSGKEHMARTTIHNLPPELKDTIQLAGRLKRAIRKKEKSYGKQQTGRPAQSSVRND